MARLTFVFTIQLLAIITLFLLALPNMPLFSNVGLNYVVRLFLNIFILLVVLTLIAALVPKSSSNIGIKLAALLLVIILLAGLTNLIYRSVRTRTFWDLEPVAIIVTTFLITAYLSPTGIRYHSSPDNHGFASAVGYFFQDFSLGALSSDFREATGLESNAFYGQPTPLLESVWQIPDAQLRFAADNVFQVGRISTPLLGAALSRLFGLELTFQWYLLFFTFLGTWIVGYLMLSVCTELAKLIGLVKKSKSLKRTQKSDAELNSSESRIFQALCKARNVYLFSTVVSFSTWSQVFIFEGTLNQVWFYVALMGSLYLTLMTIRIHLLNAEKIELLPRSKVSLFVMFPSAIGLATFYPNGVLLLIPQSAFLISVLYSSWNLYSARDVSTWFRSTKQLLFSILSYTLAASICSFFLIRDSFYVLTENFLKGAPNQPYSLGAIPFDKLLAFTNFELAFEKVTGFGTGFYPLPVSTTRALFPLLVLSSVLATLIYYEIRKFGFKTSLIQVLSLAYVTPFLLLPISALLRAEEEFFPYQYFRNLVNVFVIAMPIIGGVLLSRFDSKRRKLAVFKHPAPGVALLVVLSVSSISYIDRGKSFESNSEPFLTLEKLEEIDFSKEPFFISKSSFHQIYQLTLFGPVFNLSDGWGPKFSRLSERPIYLVEKSLDGKLEIESIGTFSINSPVRGPIFFEDIALDTQK